MADQGFWSHHLFVLISSDTVYRGRHGELAERLRKEGFQPVAARAVRATPEMIDDLYSDLIAGQWRTWRYRLVDAVLAIGPAMGVICRYTGDDPEPYRLLGRRKGYQVPTEAEPGTIRMDFGAINSVLNLMHSSDDPAESEREAAVFGLSARDAVADPEQAAREVGHLAGLIAPAVPEHRDFDATLASVRAKAVAARWHGLPAPARDRVRAVFPATAAYAKKDAGERLAGLLADDVPPALLEAVRCDYTPEWLDRLTMSDAVEQLRRIGVTLDTWERLVLETSLHFQPLRGGGKHAS
ncbi:hypothetical protein OG292_23965 [Streptomyces sp. NBC_01511]|uniref:nucleoside-diphosphate kinase n=1 Tax=unclassified Streptomyces TaxID=2593676 RepID=UPI00386B8127